MCYGSGSGTGFRPGADINCNKSQKNKNERPSSGNKLLSDIGERQDFVKFCCFWKLSGSGTGAGAVTGIKRFQSGNRNNNKSLRFHNTAFNVRGEI